MTMLQHSFLPTVITISPQMLWQLLVVTEKLIDNGYNKAAADMVNLATISATCSPESTAASAVSPLVPIELPTSYTI